MHFERNCIFWGKNTWEFGQYIRTKLWNSPVSKAFFIYFFLPEAIPTHSCLFKSKMAPSKSTTTVSTDNGDLAKWAVIHVEVPRGQTFSFPVPPDYVMQANDDNYFIIRSDPEKDILFLRNGKLGCNDLRVGSFVKKKDSEEVPQRYGLVLSIGDINVRYSRSVVNCIDVAWLEMHKTGIHTFPDKNDVSICESLSPWVLEMISIEEERSIPLRPVNIPHYGLYKRTKQIAFLFNSFTRKTVSWFLRFCFALRVRTLKKYTVK